MNAKKWTVETVTGSRLVDAELRDMGPESTGHVVSSHRTEAAAQKSLEAYQRDCPLGKAAVFAR